MSLEQKIRDILVLAPNQTVVTRVYVESLATEVGVLERENAKLVANIGEALTKIEAFVREAPKPPHHGA